MCQTGRSAPTGPMPSAVYTSSCSPVAEPMSPTALSTPDTPATATRAITASQPWPCTTDPMTRPAAPPNTAALQTRFTRLRYGPPVSAIVPRIPPIAGSTPRARWPSASDTDSGTQIARTARIISGQGTGARRGRTTSASQSGTTASRTAAARSPRVPLRVRLRSSPSAAAHRLFSSRTDRDNSLGLRRLYFRRHAASGRKVGVQRHPANASGILHVMTVGNRICACRRGDHAA